MESSDIDLEGTFVKSQPPHYEFYKGQDRFYLVLSGSWDDPEVVSDSIGDLSGEIGKNPPSALLVNLTQMENISHDCGSWYHQFKNLLDLLGVRVAEVAYDEQRDALHVKGAGVFYDTHDAEIYLDDYVQ